jgi:hypothetical protein
MKSMVIVTNISYPSENAPDMAKRFLEAPQIPDYMTKRGPYFYSTLNDGIIGLSVYELDKSKIPEGTEFLGNYMATYFGVPGFTYEIKTFFEVQEALKMIGMG